MTVLTTQVRMRVREAGLAIGLRLLLDAFPGVLVCGAGGHALVPSDAVNDAARVWLAGTWFARHDCRQTSSRTIRLPASELRALRYEVAQDAGHGPAPYTEWVVGLAWLRLGSSQRLLDACLEHLGSRTSGDEPLLQKQMIKDRLAEAVAGHLEIRSLLGGLVADSMSAELLTELHDQITCIDRSLLGLLGASGFVLGGPGDEAYASELLADAYCGSRIDGGAAW